MKNETSATRVTRMGKGLLLSMGLTLAGMAALSGLVVVGAVGDSGITPINQLLKMSSILVGTLFAVRPGGTRGLVSGVVLGVLYMLLGYGLYCALDGSMASAATLLTEILLGAGIGALSGVLAVNLHPRRSAH